MPVPSPRPVPRPAPQPAPQDAVIEILIADLAPVQPIQPSTGALWIGTAIAACTAIVAASFGVRADILALQPANIVLYRSLALIVVGIATCAAAISSARPGVGGRSREWIWAMLAASSVPILALWGASQGNAAWGYVISNSVPRCLGVSLACAAIIGGITTLWLRRGAVTEPERTAWLIGISAGASGTFAYNLTCPSTTVYYAGLWYTLAVGISAVAARIILPRFLRW